MSDVAGGEAPIVPCDGPSEPPLVIGRAFDDNEEEFPFASGSRVVNANGEENVEFTVRLSTSGTVSFRCLLLLVHCFCFRFTLFACVSLCLLAFRAPFASAEHLLWHDCIFTLVSLGLLSFHFVCFSFTCFCFTSFGFLSLVLFSLRLLCIRFSFVAFVSLLLLLFHLLVHGLFQVRMSCSRKTLDGAGEQEDAEVVVGFFQLEGTSSRCSGNESINMSILNICVCNVS
jgi:hypothetical protein